VLTTCPSNCKSCTSSNTCQTCKPTFVLDNSECITCPEGTYPSETTGSCTTCPNNCITCTDANTCQTCKPDFGLENDQCVTCPIGTTLFNGICPKSEESLSSSTLIGVIAGGGLISLAGGFLAFVIFTRRRTQFRKVHNNVEKISAKETSEISLKDDRSTLPLRLKRTALNL